MTKCNGHINQEFKGIERVFWKTSLDMGKLARVFVFTTNTNWSWIFGGDTKT